MYERAKEYQTGDWTPNPGPQLKALESNAFEILYGGARGGGKTDAGLVWMLKPIANPNFRGLVIRRNADDLSDWIDRASRLYRGYGAQIAYRPAVIKFPSGAIIRTGHLKDDQAYTKYQGHEYQRILIEELTQIPDEKRYLQLLGSCRTTVRGLDARVFCTTNPSGVGHRWVKSRFVDVAPSNTRYIDPLTGRFRIFIPAKVEDTPQLVKNDPEYVSFLEGLKNTDIELWKAWRLGDWDTFAGQYFSEFRRDNHVIRQIVPKKEYNKISGMDWGYSPRPFVFEASVCIPQQTEEGIKFNRVITYLEIDGTERIPEEWAKEIVSSVDLDEFNYIMADPSMFHKKADGSISIADQMKNYLGKNAWKLKPANNDRIGGWTMLHKWLSIAPDGLPYWLITENCHQLITNLPSLIYDENKIGDLDTEGLDDEADAVRYMLMHFKWIDAKVGGVHPKRITRNVKLIKSPLMGINLSEFEKEKKVKDWREI